MALTDEQIAALAQACRPGACPVPNMGDVLQLVAELRAYRAGEIAPEGKVLVGEADLRAMIDHANRDCIGLTCPALYQNGCTDSEQRCRAALLAHFGLAPEPEVPDADA